MHGTSTLSPISSVWRSLTCLALALVVALAGLVVAPAPQADAVDHEITEGTVTWGLKGTWRNYIGAAGTTLEDGVTRNADGTFDWPVTSGTFDDESTSLRLNLGGSVHFRLHQGPDGSYALDSLFTDLRVVISPTEQTIRGTYSGNPREGGGRVVIEDALLARIDVGSADVKVADGITTWDEARTFGGPDNGLYAEGTPFDPVSIQYTGPGGVPELGETFDVQGAPVLAPGATWLDDDATEDSRMVFASREHDVIHLIERSGFGTANAKYILRALDGTTMQQLGTTDIEAADARQWFKATFDPATDSIFLADGNPGSTGAQIRRATYDPQTHAYGNQVIADIAPIDTSASNNVTSLSWNPAKGEVIVMMSRIVAADRRFQGTVTFLSPAETGSTWDASTHPISLPDAAPVTGTLTGANAPGTSKTAPSGSRIAPLRDGTYVMLHATYRRSGDTQPYATPAMHLTRHDDSIDLTYIEGTAPAPLNDAVAYSFDGATTASDGSVLLHGYGEQYIDIVDGKAVAATEHQLRPDSSSLDGWAVSDPSRGFDYVMRGQRTTLSARTSDKVARNYQFADVNRGGLGNYYPVAVLPDGAVTLLVKDPATGNIGLRRFDLLGVTPTVSASPESRSVSLAAGTASKDVTFTSTSTGGSGTVIRQWQRRTAGQSTFVDLEGETGEALTLAAKPGMDGTEVRAVYSNPAGKVVSDVATLSVDFAPVIASDARDQSVSEGQDAVFLTSFDAWPEATYTWQRRINGFWSTIDSDDDLEVNGPTLTVHDTNVDQSGAHFRVKASNEAGSTFSRAARLTVEPRPSIPHDTELTGVTLDWAGSAELQKSPPFGGSNFLSAGVSDGSEATYRAAQGDVEVLHVDAGGRETRASWATRTAQVSGSVTQRVRLSEGRARLATDGSATVSWDGSWSVNFYGGLTPFTLTDPHLVVDDDGTGTMTVDLSGYASSQQNPNDRTPLPPVEDVVVATFNDVEINPTGTVTIDPDYADVEADLPDGQVAQVRTGAWGAWPQPFIDFHLQTGLAPYWYSSGGAADPLKAPSPVIVDFTDAETVTAPPVLQSTTTVSLARTSHAYGARTSATVRVAEGGKASTGSVKVKVAGRTSTHRLINGVTSVKLPATLKPGRFTVEAAYPGGDGVRPSSARGTLTVTKAAPIVTTKLRRTTVKRSQRAALTVTVKIPGGHQSRPTGQLVIRDGSRIIATKMLGHGHRGKVTVKLPKLGRGKHFLRASIGSTDLLSSRSSTYRALRVR